MRELPATTVILGICAGRWGRNGSSRRANGRQRAANFSCFEIVFFVRPFRPREPPKSCLRIGESATKRSPSVNEILRLFSCYHPRLSSLHFFSGVFSSVNEDPCSNTIVLGKRTRGNSGLHRSYITDSDGERKIAEKSAVGKRTSGARTRR